ncbi:hypothetical protein KL929_003966 [Ogataea haglerorum]|nr:hypothetical protein KL929_003966 [Ogataea haglerorum]
MSWRVIGYMRMTVMITTTPMTVSSLSTSRIPKMDTTTLTRLIIRIPISMGTVPLLIESRIWPPITEFVTVHPPTPEQHAKQPNNHGVLVAQFEEQRAEEEGGHGGESSTARVPQPGNRQEHPFGRGALVGQAALDTSGLYAERVDFARD